MQRIYAHNEKHVIVCVNERESGLECCAAVEGNEIFKEIKTYVMQNGLAGRVWVTRARCLGFCNSEGAVMVIYPDGIWLKGVTRKDLQEIFSLITPKN